VSCPHFSNVDPRCDERRAPRHGRVIDPVRRRHMDVVCAELVAAYGSIDATAFDSTRRAPCTREGRRYLDTPVPAQDAPAWLRVRFSAKWRRVRSPVGEPAWAANPGSARVRNRARTSDEADKTCRRKNTAISRITILSMTSRWSSTRSRNTRARRRCSTTKPGSTDALRRSARGRPLMRWGGGRGAPAGFWAGFSLCWDGSGLLLGTFARMGDRAR